MEQSYQLIGEMSPKKTMKEKTDPHLPKANNGERDSYDYPIHH